MKIMKIKYTSIIVNDIKESTKFYKETFKLKIIEEYENPELSMTMLTDGEHILELIQNNQDAEINNIGFEVENLRDIIKKIEDKKINFIYKPKKDDEIQYALFKDPNGLLISLSEKKILK